MLVQIVLCLAILGHVWGQQCIREVPFDFTMLALQWPPGICYSNNKVQCVDYEDKFTIHGNWPSFNNGSWPEFCCFQRNFDRRKVDQVEDSLKVCVWRLVDNQCSLTSSFLELQQKWGTLFTGGTDEGFWRHEWQKHGTCAATSPSLKGQTNYFVESLALYDRAQIKEWFRAAKIVPQPADSTRLYSVKEIHHAIESKTGHKIRLECRRLPKRIAKEPIFSGLYICYDPDTLAYIDCPKPDDQDCGGQSLMYLSSG